MSDEPRDQQQPPSEGYEPPRVEDIPAKDGPAVTAAGDSPKLAILIKT
jgi:hypothetical protein